MARLHLHNLVRYAFSAIALILQALFELVFFYKAKPSLFMIVGFIILNYITSASIAAYLLLSADDDSDSDHLPDPNPMLSAGV